MDNQIKFYWDNVYVSKTKTLPKNKDKMYTLHSLIRAKRINNVQDQFVD